MKYYKNNSKEIQTSIYIPPRENYFIHLKYNEDALSSHINDGSHNEFN